MFTDLDQVKEGDLVYLYVLNKTLTYEVDKITVTTPDDTDAIQIIDGEDLLTLLTCTPYGTNTHRLLVRGHRIFPDETLSTSKPSEAKPDAPPTRLFTDPHGRTSTETGLRKDCFLLCSFS